MWSPTHVQVTVQKARGLVTKGKNGTNDAFVTIELGKEKFQTSIKQKSLEIVEWHEKCELSIPKQGNRAEVVLTVLHHNFLGLDEFLGCICLPLSEMDVYERPKNRWIKLKGKPGKEKSKERGELEVKIGFTVKSGSLSNLSKKEKHKSSLGQLSQAAHSFGGSLISIRSLDKRKGLKSLASKIVSVANKKSRNSHRARGDGANVCVNESTGQMIGDADPGVISEGDSDDDFTLDELSHKGSGHSLNFGSSQSTKSIENISTSSGVSSKYMTFATDVFPDPKIDSELKAIQKKGKDTNMNFPKTTSLERIIIGKEITRSPSPANKFSPDLVHQFEGKSKEDLIELIIDLQRKLNVQQKYQRDLEDYLDNLLLRVMETTPRILQNPYINHKPYSNV